MDNDTPLAPPTEVLERYLAGRASPAEAQQASAWIDADATRRACAEALKSLDPVAELPSDRTVDRLWVRFHERMDRPSSLGVRPTLSDDRAREAGRPTGRANGSWSRDWTRSSGRAHAVRRWSWIAGAAVSVLVGALAIGVLGRIGVSPGIARTYTTTAGQRLTLTLGDGSRVTMAPQSTVTLSGDERTVTLAGEAVFVVQPNTRAPFVVHTGVVRIRVLGTTFDIRHYPTDTGVHVAVASGKVVVSADTRQHPSIVLTAGAIGTVTDSTAQAVVGDVSAHTDWVNGHLVFDRAPVSDVLRALERWYGYKFRLTDPGLSGRHITTILDYNAPAKALQRLELLLNVELFMDGDSAVLRPRTRSTHSIPREPPFPDQLFPSTTEVGR